MTKSCDVLVIGSGPSGLLASLIASKKRKVVLLEKPGRHFQLGKRILVSGNGRANFFNDALLEDPCSKDLLSYLEKECHFAYTKEKDLYYPFFNRSECLLTPLLAKLKEQKVEVLPLTLIGLLPKENQVLCLDEEGKKVLLSYQDLVLALGGKSYDREDYDDKLLAPLKVKSYPFSPCLCPVKVKEKIPSYLEKNRLKGILSLYLDENCLYKEEGEVLFKKDGLSGICVFNSTLVVNQLLREKKKGRITYHLDYLFHRDSLKQSDYFLSFPSYLQRFIQENHFSYGHELVFTFESLYPFKDSQISYGGILLEEIDEKTYQLRKHPHIYVLGEMLDINLPCGGYNIGTCFLEGYKVGTHLGGLL